MSGPQVPHGSSDVDPDEPFDIDAWHRQLKLEEEGDEKDLPVYLRRDSQQNLPEVTRPLIHALDQPTLAAMVEELDKENTLPVKLANDIYTIFYQPSTVLKFAEYRPEVGWRHTLIQNLYHSYVHILTERNVQNSYVITQELVKELVKHLKEKNCNSKQKSEKELGRLGEDAAKGGKLMQNIRQRALDNARPQMQKMEDDLDMLPQEPEQDKGSGGDAPGGNAAGDGTINTLEDLRKMLELMKQLGKVKIERSVISAFIKHSLKGASTYFSRIYRERPVSLLEASEIHELDGLEFLHPNLMFLLDEVTTTERIPQMQFDLYLDISGSMGSGTKGMRNIDLVKLLTLALIKKKLVNEVHFFDTSLYPVPNSPSKILARGLGGGTNTEMIARRIAETHRPAMVLTDMADQISTYTDRAYFVGIGPARMYNTDAGTQYLRAGQFALFDGEKLIPQRPDPNAATDDDY